MKVFSFLLPAILFLSCANANAKGKTYMGSTPANATIRSGIGIPPSDSVDFIRWWIILEEKKFTLKCNYGVGKPNTSGFINGGKWIHSEGVLRKENNYYHFQIGDRELVAVELNSNLIHLTDANKDLLVGTGGWSYTLNAESPLLSDQVNIISKKETLKDSMIFLGRTLCNDFSINRPGRDCIKMKWSIIFYADPQTHEPTTYLLNHSNSMPLEYPGKKGTWKIIAGKDGRIIYELKPANENEPTYLLKLDNNVLEFTDAKGNLLVGNKDFSFTLSRK